MLFTRSGEHVNLPLAFDVCSCTSYIHMIAYVYKVMIVILNKDTRIEALGSGGGIDVRRVFSPQPVRSLACSCRSGERIARLG